MSEALIVQQSRFSSIWLVPVVAVIAGLWVIIQAQLSEGPEITVTFATAEGLIANETKVKRLSVELGVVKSVYLNPGYNDVTAVIKLDSDTEDLLRDDSHFWVVRPRIGADGISGLGSILTGAYIELAPGQGEKGKREYRGLDDLPLTSKSTPGAHLRLTSEQSASVSVGSPVLYNGYQVGRVEKVKLSAEDRQVYYEVFVEAPYNDLISSNTRFWNASGFHINAGVDGISLESQSLETLIAGGISFGLPAGMTGGEPIHPDQEFILYPRRSDINKQPYVWGREYLLVFDSSVRGLQAGAPVEYRGIRIGSVLEVSLDLIPKEQSIDANGEIQIPVLIRIDPGRIGDDEEAGLAEVDDFFQKGVSKGLRGSLASGNLLTGSLFVSLDFYDGVKADKVRTVGKYTILPSVSTGIDHLQKQITAFLDKLQKLPLKETITTANGALNEFGKVAKTADSSLEQVNQLLDAPETKSLPLEMQKSLQELQSTLAGFSPDSAMYGQLQSAVLDLQESLASANQLLHKLEQKPNALVFPSSSGEDLVPGSELELRP